MPLLQMKKWALLVRLSWKKRFFGSVTFGTDKISNLFSISPKVFKGTFHRGKLWRNFVSFSWSNRRALPDLVSSVFNQDRTILVQRLTSTMASLTQKSSPRLSSWSPFNKFNPTYFSTFITSQVRRIQTLMI